MNATTSFRQEWLKLREGLHESAAREEAQQRSTVPPEALDHLVLLPVWTVGLARACDFPVPAGEAVEELLGRLRELGLCLWAPPAVDPEADDEDDVLDDSDRQRFWMADDERHAHLERWIAASERPGPHDLVTELAGRVLAAEQAGVAVLPIQHRWARLAAAFPAVGQRLLGELAEEPAMARPWLEAARPLKDALGGDVSTAYLRGLRSLEYEERRAADRRHLEGFVERRTQLDAFEELRRQEDDGPWALHFLGTGGSGKTMLMRYLHLEHIPKLGGVAARIDFDYVNPNYPSREPGLLLVQLAEELRLHAGSGATEELFSSFFDVMTTLHETLGATAPGVDRGDPIASPEFGYALDLLADALHHLPRPVVFLLDTCEELAKVETPQESDKAPRNVEDTFRILSQMHQRFQALRVVFCGRRLLASRGPGWWVSGSRLPERECLRLHLMRGFSESLATSYLADAEVPAKLHPAILKKSPFVGSSIRVKGQAADGEANRYSPYSLFLYASWVRDMPGITAKEIRDDHVDQFVRIRILSRLRPELHTLLPAVALLGRFDRATLLAALGFSDAPPGFDDQFRELANQEWTTRQDAGFVEVDAELRPRLLAHFKDQGRRLEEMGRRAVRYLKDKVVDPKDGTVDPAAVAPAEIEVALRLMAPEPDEAAAWWARLELGLVKAGAWDWAEDLAKQLLARVAGPGSPLRAAVLATLAAAHLHTRRQVDRSAWEAVREATKSASDPQAERLRRRALLALLPRDETAVNELERLAGEVPDGQLLSAFVAVLEGVAEEVKCQYEAAPAVPLKRLSHVAQLLALHAMRLGEDPLHAFLCILEGRFQLLLGNRTAANTAFDRAMALRRKFSLTGSRWLDWRAPDDLGARIALEFLCATYARTRGAHDLAKKVSQVFPESSTIDADRLASACLTVLRSDTYKASEQLPLPSFDSPEPEWVRAHRRFPPLFAARALAQAWEGRIDEALQVVEERHSRAESSSDFDTVLAVLRVGLELAFLMRLPPRDVVDPRALLRQGSEPDRDLVLRWLALLSEPERNSYSVDATRYRPVFDKDAARALVKRRRFSASISDSPEGLARVAKRIEAVELQQLVRRWNLDWPPADTDAGVPVGWKTLLLRGEDPDEVMSLWLRNQALRKGNLHQTDLVGYLGRRRSAEIAWREGSLLALRLPEPGGTLLSTARRWFQEAADPVGITLSGVSLALLCCRERQGKSALRAILNPLKHDYEGFRQGRGGQKLGLASWLQLRERALGKRLETMAAESAAWQPWLLRIVAVLAWDADGCRAGPCTQRIRALSAEIFGERSDGSSLVPPELHFLEPETSKTAKAGIGWPLDFNEEPVVEGPPEGGRGGDMPGDEEGTSPKLEEELERIGEDDARRRDEAERRSPDVGFEPMGDDTDPPPHLGEAPSRSTRGVPRSGVTRNSRDRWITKADGACHLRIRRLEPSDAWPIPSGELRVALEPRVRRGKGPFKLELAGGFLPYAELCDPERLDELRYFLDVPDELGLEIELEREIAWFPWEALLLPSPALGIRRHVQGTPLRYRPSTVGPVRIASLVPSLDHLAAVREGWSELEERVHLLSYEGDEIRDLLRKIHSKTEVVHLIARPVAATAGPRFELETSDHDRSRTRGRLLRAIELSKFGPEPQLWILQPLIRRGNGERHRAVREQAACLKLLAAELQERGAPAVLTLPGLPEKETIQLLRLLAEALTRGPLSIELLQESVVEMQGHLLSRDRLEPAADLTCYIPPQEI